jgi:hypothetical protein
MKIMVSAAFLAAIVTAAPALAGPGVIIGPVAATINSGGPGFGSIADTYNENGLFTKYTSGVTNFDAYIAGNPIHTDIFAGNEWFSNSGTTSASVTYDLGSIKKINALALWNEESSGIGQLALGGDGGAIGVYTPFDNPLANYSAQVFTFTTVTTRFVTFGLSGCPQPNPGNFPACAIGEVAFRTAAAVPEPSSWALLVVGFGLVGTTLRRRAVRVAA